MRLLTSLIGYFLIFVSGILGIYDGMMSARYGKNLFHSVKSTIHVFEPNLITSYRFGMTETDPLWVDLLLPIFSFPVFLLMFMIGLVFISMNKKTTIY